MERQPHDHAPVELSAQLVSIMTTEHYNLQTGRSIAIAEVNGRTSLFVGAVSSTLIALTLVAQISHLGTAFFVFSLVVLPTLIFMGLSTFERALVGVRECGRGRIPREFRRPSALWVAALDAVGAHRPRSLPKPTGTIAASRGASGGTVGACIVRLTRQRGALLLVDPLARCPQPAGDGAGGVVTLRPRHLS